MNFKFNSDTPQYRILDPNKIGTQFKLKILPSYKLLILIEILD